MELLNPKPTKKPVLYKTRPEKLIRKLCMDELTADGWTCWYPIRPQFSKTDCDIFGMYDIAAWKYNEIRFIQITTSENFDARVKKIKGILHANHLALPLPVSSEVWGLYKTGGWRVGSVRH